jgi:hypothetical protein
MSPVDGGGGGGGGGGGAPFATVTVTVAVVWLPAASRAVALMLCDPFATEVESHVAL